MFTGIVQAVGTVAAVRRSSGRLRLEVDLGAAARGVRRGDSVAVDGVCLTATGRRGRRVAFDVVQETLERTRLSRLGPGDRVNLERALRAGDPLGGHWVQGHVDGVGTVRERRSREGDEWFRVEVEPSLARHMVRRGSVAADGVSLTVADAGRDWFAAALIPHTLEHTTWGEKRPGARVHVETDVLAKYVERLLGARPRRKR